MIDLHAKLDVSSFNRSKDMEGGGPKILKVGHMTPTGPEIGGCW